MAGGTDIHPAFMERVEERREMVELDLLRRDVREERVLEAMRRVPRHVFVPEGQRSRAYCDMPLPIGCNQTISQPYIVACMTQALELRGPERVLEIGTGSGYQTAILAELAAAVYSLERWEELSRQAGRTLAELGYTNVHLRVGDGTLGWPEEAPFDAILVTAAAPDVPLPLKEQLGDGGRLVLPVGDQRFQDLLQIRRLGSDFRRRNLGGCAFVPLIGEQGWDRDRREHEWGWW
jgi:protein-L-isoaspartate(D-aspartate) O-methyltransferase